MNNNSARRASIILGVFMAIVLVAGAIIPLFTQNTPVTQTTNPTDVPIPTFPPAPSNLSAITFDSVYLHPTGIFSIGQPVGWTASEPNKGPSIAQVNITNNDNLSVVDTYVEDAGEAGVTAAELSDRFNQDVINASWARFNQWSETSRNFDEATGTLQIDFNITLNRQQYVARQQVWTDGRWIYVVRVLAPENATELLRYLLDGFVASFTPNTFFQGTPLDWSAYYDSADSHIIRYPAEWSVTDSAPGRPTSITSNNGVQLRVESREGVSVADEDAATAFVEGLRSNITTTSVRPITRGTASGFAVAYTFTNIDGDAQSGLADLLNGTDGTLHVADLRFPAANIDLNALNVEAAADATVEGGAEATAEATAEVPSLNVTDASMIDVYRDLATVMSTFTVVTPIPVAQPDATPTFVPTATLEVTAEATAESTVEAVEEVEATEEATADATAEATAEATEAS